jgi:hypothetical protein
MEGVLVVVVVVVVAEPTALSPELQLQSLQSLDVASAAAMAATTPDYC